MSYHQYQGDQMFDKTASSVNFNQPQGPLMLSESLYAGARLQFVKKVYIILTIQLVLTLIMSIISMEVEGFLDFQMRNQWLMWVCFSFIIITQIVIICVPAGRKFPINMICLLIFTLCEAYLVSFICSLTAQTEGKFAVIISASMTLAITVAATLYATFTKTDFTTKWGIIIVLLCSMLFLGIFSIFWYDRFMVILYCTLGVMLFGIYLIIDTQMILGGKRLQFSVDDYAAAALLLYIDIIQIFLYILSLFQKK